MAKIKGRDRGLFPTIQKGGQLLTSAAASAILVVRDFDSLFSLVDNFVRIDNFVCIVLAIVPEVSHDVGTSVMCVVELLTTIVANVFFDFLVVEYFRNRLCGVMLHPIVLMNRLCGFGRFRWLSRRFSRFAGTRGAARIARRARAARRAVAV